MKTQKRYIKIVYYMSIPCVIGKNHEECDRRSFCNNVVFKCKCACHALEDINIALETEKWPLQKNRLELS
jgi:hypothetical protein